MVRDPCRIINNPLEMESIDGLGSAVASVSAEKTLSGRAVCGRRELDGAISGSKSLF